PVVVILPACKLTSTPITPGNTPTAAFTDETQCPQIIPRTWYVVAVIVIILSPNGVGRSHTRIIHPRWVPDSSRQVSPRDLDLGTEGARWAPQDTLPEAGRSGSENRGFRTGP